MKPATSPSVPSWFVEPAFGQRLLGRVIDTIVLLPIGLALAALTGVSRGDERLPFWAAATGLVVGATYEIGFVATSGQTIGKRVMRTKVVRFTDGAVPLGQEAALRWLVLNVHAAIGLLLPAGDVWMGPAWSVVLLLFVLRPPLHRGPHDFAAGTVVVSVAVRA